MAPFPVDPATAIAGAAALAAVLMVAVPRPWLPATMIAVLLLPVLAYLGVIGWEIATRPPEPNAARNALLGFMLISSVAALPWLLVCGVAFAAGLALRAVLRPHARHGNGGTGLPRG
ncbi:hypothetical protein ACE7GA_17490 [Roseomonas sp. CCTCC AB2023176]|uniref:hypothetical protein n=1 Tax=Roseomonas sp. CCTCC AB2023176 TaxID=3342640 RepID=UPI0035DFDEF8